MLPLDALHRMVTQVFDRLVDQVCEFSGEEDVAAERLGQRLEPGGSVHGRAHDGEVESAGWVPALVCPDGAVLTETPAINLYLGERHGITSLVPAVNDPDRARFLSSLFYITGEIEPALKRNWYPHTFGDGDNTAEAIRKRALATALSGFALVDSRLDAGGPCHLGERFSLVDLMIAFWAITFERTDEMRQLPRVLACVEMARARTRLTPLFDIIDTWKSDFNELTKDL